MREGLNWVDFFRLAIFFMASLFAGTSVWIMLKTSYTSAKVMLIGILCLTAGHIGAAWQSLGEPSPGLVYLIGTPLGYCIAIKALLMWKCERGMMAHDYDLQHDHGPLWHWLHRDLNIR